MQLVISFQLLLVLFLNLRDAFSDTNATKLILIQIISRHGERSPDSIYPNDPTPKNFWPEGLGQLTQRGRLQHYALGKFLNLFYASEITTDPGEIRVESTEDPYCMRSALSNIASFYAPREEWKFEGNFNWQPIPVYYVPKKNDKCLDHNSYCPRSDAERDRIIRSPESLEYLAKHEKMLKNLSSCSGRLMHRLMDPYRLHKTLFVEKNNNRPIPSCFVPFWEELDDFAAVSFFKTFDSPIIHRLRAGPFIKYAINVMDKKLAGDLPKLKVQMYFSHHTNIGVLLDALKLYNMKQPAYCASVIFELHQLEDGTNAVRILYLNSSNPEKEIKDPHVLKLDGCHEFCPLDYFKDFTKELLPDDWHKECQLNNSAVKGKGLAVFLFLALMTIILLR